MARTSPRPERPDVSVVRLAALAACIAAAACSTPPDTNPAGVFIAFGRDFMGFETWPSMVIAGAAEVALGDAGIVHAAGKRTLYVNQLPPADATVFPVGTIIVKVMEADGKIFARAKRGGGYNRTGALDWEWFEIEHATGGAIFIVWHGVGPPAGEMYAGDASGGCNGCHKGGAANDYVLSAWPPLPGLTAVPEPNEIGDGGAVEDASVD